MSNIIIPGNLKSNKDCNDWIPLKDGTLTGDSKYCDLSLQCKQIDMRSDWYWYIDMITGEKCFDYFCTGIKVTEEDKCVDEEVS